MEVREEVLGQLRPEEDDLALRMPGDVFRHPREVLSHPGLTPAERRAILAGWASDAHAVPSCPSLRRLPGTRAMLVPVDDVLAALSALDAAPEPRRKVAPQVTRRRPFRPLRSLIRPSRRDDDDDPPPAPVAALPPRPPAPILDAVAVAA